VSAYKTFVLKGSQNNKMLAVSDEARCPKVRLFDLIQK